MAFGWSQECRHTVVLRLTKPRRAQPHQRSRSTKADSTYANDLSIGKLGQPRSSRQNQSGYAASPNTDHFKRTAGSQYTKHSPTGSCYIGSAFKCFTQEHAAKGDGRSRKNQSVYAAGPNAQHVKRAGGSSYTKHCPTDSCCIGSVFKCFTQKHAARGEERRGEDT